MIYDVDRGRRLPNIPLAKRMQEEALLRGVAITLDEMFQNVLSWQMNTVAQPLNQDGLVMEDEAVKRFSSEMDRIQQENNEHNEDENGDEEEESQ